MKFFLLFNKTETAFIIYLLIINIVSFITFGIDKKHLPSYTQYYNIILTDYYIIINIYLNGDFKSIVPNFISFCKYK